MQRRELYKKNIRDEDELHEEYVGILKVKKLEKEALGCE